MISEFSQPWSSLRRAHNRLLPPSLPFFHPAVLLSHRRPRLPACSLPALPPRLLPAKSLLAARKISLGAVSKPLRSCQRSISTMASEAISLATMADPPTPQTPTSPSCTPTSPASKVSKKKKPQRLFLTEFTTTSTITQAPATSSPPPPGALPPTSSLSPPRAPVSAQSRRSSATPPVAESLAMIVVTSSIAITGAAAAYQITISTAISARPSTPPLDFSVHGRSGHEVVAWPPWPCHRRTPSSPLSIFSRPKPLAIASFLDATSFTPIATFLVAGCHQIPSSLPLSPRICRNPWVSTGKKRRK